MKIALVALALALPLAETAQAPAPSQHGTPANRLEARPGCTPIVVQVAGAERRHEGATRLDQEPPAQLLYAVDREVDGCREATFVKAERERLRRGR